MKKFEVQNVSKIIPLTLSVAIISVMMCLTIMAAWIPPGQTPPGGNVAAPINTSGNAQGKLGNLGIGTTDPEAKLDIAAGNLDLDGTANTNQFGIITKNGTPFIHNFNYGYNGTITTAGKNTFVGLNAGNLTMGSTASQTYHSSSNTGVGANALFSNTTGYANSACGNEAMMSSISVMTTKHI